MFNKTNGTKFIERSSQQTKKLRSRRAARRFQCEQLEDRRLLAAQPTVTLQAPAQVMIGESFELTATFDNTSATDPGYGPFVDLYVPVNGIDGVGGVGADGISFNSASYLGASITTTVLTFPDDGGGVGAVDHPYAVDTSGAPLTITGPAGDHLVVMQLPFGSFTADQPAAAISIDMSVSNFADLSQLLTLRARSGFQFGNDPLANPATDPSLVSNSNATATAWTDTAPIEPTLITLTKEYLGPEDETATGPNFPRQYRLEIDVANGQTVTNLDVTDLLPNNIQLVSVDSILPAGSVTTTPTTPANAPNNGLVITLPTVTGTTSTNDASITFTYFVPFRDADGQTVIDPVSGDDVVSQNNAAALGDWDPLDPRDAASTNNASADDAGPEHTLTPKSIAVQKSVSIVSDLDGNGLSPGDVLEYQIEFQISDFFGFENVVVTDVTSDGQRFDLSFAPTLSFQEHGNTTNNQFGAAQYSIVDHYTGASSPVAPLDGTQEIEFRVSDELVARSLNGVLLGGLVPVGGTGGSDPTASTFDGGATQGTIIFRTIVQELFSDDFPSGDPSVDEGDEITNSVQIQGDVLSYTDTTPTNEVEADGSGTQVSVPAGPLVKSIYAVNGSTTLPSPLRLAPGDELTYRIQLTLPTSDVEDLALHDFLPLPVFFASEVTSFVDVIDNTVPAAGTAKFGPNETFRAIYGNTPGLTTDAVSNSVVFDYGDFDIGAGSSRTIDILFTVTASDEPFADGLMLTNQVRRSQDTTNTVSFVNDAIVQIELGMPELHVTKGIVNTDNPSGQFSPDPPSSVAFSSPGSAGFRAGATIASTTITAVPIDSNLEEVDAGDLVTFAVIIENQGSSRAGAFDVQIRDQIPTGFVVPGSGINLSVTDGTGAAITYTNLGTGLFDAAGGIELTDPGPTTATIDGTDGGAIDAYHLTSGRNIVVITYDLQLASTVSPNQAITNTATLYNYAGSEGGVDFTTNDLTDTATVTTAAMVVAKSVTDTNQTSTADPAIAIGEIITYESVLTVPEGAAPNVQWIDLPDAGLSIVDIVTITPSTPAVTSSIGSFATVLSNGTIATNGDSVSLNFGTLTNTDTNNATAETITIEYRVVTLNRNTNNRGTQLNNFATLSWTGGADSAAAPNMTVVEPTLDITKTITPATGQATDLFVVTLDVVHTSASNATAFDVSLTDVLPTGLSFDSGLASTGATTPSTLSQSSGTITAVWNTFALGSVGQIVFNARLTGTVAPSEVVTNAATLTYTSLPGDETTPLSSDAISTERTGNTLNPGGNVNDYRDTANDTITVIAPTIAKAVISSDQAHTSGTNVAIGEIVTYETTLTIPQSTMTGVTYIDTPTAGLSMVDIVSIIASPTVTSSIGPMLNIASSVTIPADGSSFSLNFGTLTNSDSDNLTTETIVIQYRAIVLNTLTNDRADALDNSAVLAWNTTNTVSTTADDLIIVEPTLTVAKSFSAASAQAGETVTVTIDIAHSGASNATAFDVVLTDVLPTNMSFVGNLAATGTATPTSLTESSGTITAVWTSYATTGTTQIQFDVVVDTVTELGTSLTNTAQAAWTSLPGDESLPAASNPLSNERSGNTSHAGGTANDYRASSSDILAIIPPAMSKTILTTNQAHSLNQDIVIGEVITYQVALDVPQGTMSAAELVDLVDAGLAIIGINSITASSGVTTSIGSFNDVISNATLSNEERTLTIDFGDVTNSDTDANVTETIVIEYDVVVLNTNTNNRTTVLGNDAEFTWNGTSTATDAAPDVTIIEPELAITKSLSSSTVQAGEVITVTVDIAHTSASNASAMDVSLEDVLPTGMVYVGNLTSASGLAPTSLTAVADTISATWSAFPVGSTSQITFDVTLAASVVLGSTVSNSVDLIWSSAAGDVTTPQTGSPVSTERTGSTSDPGGAVNDHSASSTDQVSLPPSSVTKDFVSSNQAHSPTTSVVIGELVTYELTLTLPQGSITGAQWTDTPDAGLAIVDIISVTASSGVTSSLGLFSSIASAATIASDGSTMTIDFGTLTNADTNLLSNETVVVTYRAVVLNTTANVRGQSLDNQATFEWNTTESSAVDADDLVIVEPAVEITKSLSTSSTFASEPFRVTIDIVHGSASDVEAKDVVLTDVLPTGMVFAGNLVSSAGLAPTSLTAAGNTITGVWNSFPIGSTAQIEFDVTLAPTVLLSSTVQNSAEVTWTSATGDVTTPQSSNSVSTERTGDVTDPGGALNVYRDTAAASVDLVDPTVAKSINATNQSHSTGNNVVVGELITYELILTLPQGSVDNAEWVDTPATGLAIVDVLSITASSDVTTSQGTFADVAVAAVIPADGSSLSIDFGTLTNSNTDGAATETVTVRFRAVVLNTPANNRATTLDNEATFTWNTAESLTVDATDVVIVEPELQVTVSNATPATADAGDIVTFTIDVSHTGSSNVHARDVILSNLVDSAGNHLILVPGSIMVSETGSPTGLTTSETGGDLQVAWTEFPLGATATITFEARIASTAPPLTTLVDTATVSWTSAIGDVTAPQSSNGLSVERTGETTDPGGVSNDHRAEDDGSVQTTAAQGVKSVTDTSMASTAASQHDNTILDVAIGEEITYRIEATLPEGTTTLIVTDQLPTIAGTLSLIDVNVLSTGANLTLGSGRPTETISDTNSDNFDDRVVLDFGSILNTPDGMVSDADRIAIEIRALVVDVAANADGQLVSNSVLIDYGTGQTTAMTDVEVVEPVLLIVKDIDSSSGPAGETVTYTITVSHDPSSTSDAFDLSITDLLTETNVTLVPGSVTTTRGTVTTGNGPTDSTVLVSAGTLALAETMTVTFSGIINPDLLAAVAVNNTSELTWDSTPGPGGRVGNDDDPATYTTTAPEIDLTIDKSDDPDPVSVDDPLQYILVVGNNGPSTATNIVVTDTLPADVVIDGLSITVGTVSAVGQVVTASIPQLRPGDTISITVNVLAPPTEGTITNHAEVTATETETNTNNNSVDEPTIVLATSDLMGRNWVDVNGNGVFDTGERALPGVLLTLTGTDSRGQMVTRTTTSGPDGSYEFLGLRAGTYTVRQTQPSLFIDSEDYVGDRGGTIPANDELTVTMVPGLNATGYNFTEAGLIAPALSKRMLLLSNLIAGGQQAETAILDAVFAQLAATGRGDLDNDGDSDADDYALFLASLGGNF